MFVQSLEHSMQFSITPYAGASMRRRRSRFAMVLTCGLIVSAALVAAPTPASAAAPAPCGVVTFDDPSGDGHHSETDVLQGWFSEGGGGLQATLKVKTGSWLPAHEDEEVNGAGYAMLFRIGGAAPAKYVRVFAPPNGSGPVSYDAGTWTSGGGFASQFSTTGLLVYGAGGTVTIDVPAALGWTAGSILTSTFALTYDGTTAGVPHWVDRAPGGTSPTESSFGADFVVGSCNAPTGTTPTPDGSTPAQRTTGVALVAPAKLAGGGAARITGTIVPARDDVWVTIERTTSRSTIRLRVRTRGDGSFVASIPVREATRVRAVAEGLSSQARTIAVDSRTRAFVVRRAAGTSIVVRTWPALPGQVLLLGVDDVEPAVDRKMHGGRIVLSAGTVMAGRYQVVFIPDDERAERSTSNTVTIR
jgi:hypothetical protein